MKTELIQRFIDSTNKYWDLLPQSYRTDVDTFVNALRNDYTPSQFINENVPSFWLENKEIMDAFYLFLEHLTKNFGVTLTPEKVKANAQLVNLKTKEPAKIIETFYNSVNRNYTRPFVIENEFSDQMLGIGLPTVSEIKTTFKTYYPHQDINEKFIAFFEEFNLWAKSNPKHRAFFGVALGKFAKELSKITDQSLGKTWTALRYLRASDTTTLPLEYSVILTWANSLNS